MDPRAFRASSRKLDKGSDLDPPAPQPAVGARSRSASRSRTRDHDDSGIQLPTAIAGDRRKASVSCDHSGIHTKIARLEKEGLQTKKSVSFDDDAPHPEARGSADPNPGGAPTLPIAGGEAQSSQPAREDEQSTVEYDPQEFDEQDATAEYLAYGVLTPHYNKELAREARQDDWQDLLQ